MASARTDVKPTTTDGSHTATADRLSAEELRNTRRLLARLQLPGRRHDLFAGQPAAA